MSEENKSAADAAAAAAASSAAASGENNGAAAVDDNKGVAANAVKDENAGAAAGTDSSDKGKDVAGEDGKGKDGTDVASKGESGQEVKYDLKFAENVPIDDSAKNKFIDLAKTAGLKPEDAQKMVDLQSEINAQYAAAAEAEHKKIVKGWGDQSKAKYGADFEKKLAAGQKALATYFSPEAIKVLGDEGTGIGNHPEIVDALVKIGETLGEDKMVNGQPAKAPTSIENLWFPGMNEQFK